ncbi:MAG: GspH/FimT family pseudopilin [Deltaproteobacteria bacterium]|nr:GspH/FimT family pseudopilin [Deltaproteobacteria bacterium]
MNKVQRQRGFTLIELLVVLGVLSLLGGIAFVQLPPILAQARLNSGVRQVAVDLQAVRARAISQNRRFRVTFRTSTHDYIVEMEDGSSWTRLVLHSHTSEEVDEALITLPPGVTINSVNSGGKITFVPRGHVDGGMTVTLGSGAISDTRKIVVNLAGRVRIE